MHTHDTAGTGVATQLAAAAAGADMIDCAIDSMSGASRGFLLRCCEVACVRACMNDLGPLSQEVCRWKLRVCCCRNPVLMVSEWPALEVPVERAVVHSRKLMCTKCSLALLPGAYNKLTRLRMHQFPIDAGTTSQPCMGAIVNALAGTDGDTGVSPSELLPLITFWEQTRGLYRPFESDMRSPSTDVYQHEMPGAQSRGSC